jgi:ADP-heptose:LPS heptosyltransferase
MKVDTMRAIDYYAGVPLCFLMTVLFWITKPFRKSSSGAPRNVAFIELSEMGSAIIVDPAMRKMQAYGAELFFVIFKKNAASLRLLGTVPEENVYTIREDGLFPLTFDTLSFLFWARKRGIDTAIDLELFSRYSALLTGLCGARRRIGFHAFHNEGLYRGELLTHRVSYNPHMHIAKNFVALVNTALSEREELPYSKTSIGDDEIVLAKVQVDETHKAAMRIRIRHDFPPFSPAQHRLVLINPNASELLVQRRWMPERYVEVMRTLLARYPDVVIGITGAPAENEEAEGLRMQVDSERCVNLAGRTKFHELPALYSIATLMLTNDSGPGHFSAVTDMPTFVIFGPETPRLYGSLGNSTPIYAGLACSPCVSASNHRKTPCIDNVCLQVITPQQVLDAITPVLERSL